MLSSSFLPRSALLLLIALVGKHPFSIGKIVKSLSLWGPLWGMGKVTFGKELLAVSMFMAAVLQPSSVREDGGGAEFFLRLTRLLMASKRIFIDQQHPEETTSRAWLSSIVSARLLFVGAEGGRRGSSPGCDNRHQKEPGCDVCHHSEPGCDGHPDVTFLRVILATKKHSPPRM